MAARANVIYLNADWSRATRWWCDTCQLPSGITVPLVGLSGDGVTDLMTYSVCQDCGSHEEGESC